MRLLVTGDREWNDKWRIQDIITARLPMPGNQHVLIHGNARGADRLAADIARVLGIKLESYPADWTNQGLAAGSIRNRKMLKEGKPDMVIAFHNNIERSKGTKNMINISFKKVPTYLYTSTEGPILIERVIP